MHLVDLIGVSSVVPQPDLVDDASEVLQEGPSSSCHSLQAPSSTEWGTGPHRCCGVNCSKHVDRTYLRAIFLICHLLRLTSCAYSSMVTCSPQSTDTRHLSLSAVHTSHDGLP